MLLAAALTFLLSCQKPIDNPNPTVPPGPTPPPVITPASPADTAKTIFFDTREDDVTGNSFTTLTAFAPNGAMKWKRTQLGTSSKPYMTVNNSVIYFSASYFQFLNGGPSFVSYNNLYAINVESGSNLWANTNSNDYVYSMVARNDTLFCSMTSGSSNFIGAYKATTGTLLWKSQISYPYAATNLTLDGNRLYFATASSTTVNNIVAFDIASRTIKWDTPIGINISGVFSNMAIEGSNIFLRNGVGNLLALNKATGSNIWSKVDRSYDQPVVGNSIAYTTTENGLAAFSTADGTPKWQWDISSSWFKGGLPFLSDKKIYISGVGNAGFVARLDAATGSVEWKKDMSDVLQYPLVAADKLVLFRSATLNSGQASIMIYDAKTGIAKSTIPLSGSEFNRPSIITGSGKWIHTY